jgi:hypothetical protein
MDNNVPIIAELEAKLLGGSDAEKDEAKGHSLDKCHQSLATLIENLFLPTPAHLDRVRTKHNFRAIF